MLLEYMVITSQANNVPLNKYERGGTDPLETNIKVQGLKRRFIHDCNSIIK